MREIKFRQAMFDGDGRFSQFSYWGVVEGVFVPPAGYTFRGLSGEELVQTSGQYIERKDKNGIEIYEGDLIRINHQWRDHPAADLNDRYITAEIVFQNGAFWFMGEGFTDCNWHFYDDIEVVGNVYETPALLGNDANG